MNIGLISKHFCSFLMCINHNHNHNQQSGVFIAK